MDINEFVNITSKAWAIPILSSMHKGIPGRQVSLLRATGANRTAFGQSMQHLLEIGLVERNPGHGHPLRAEFRLTKIGEEAGKLASAIRESITVEDQTLLRKAWTLPVLGALRTPRYFGEIKTELTTITDRALSQSLKAMETKHWVTRRINEETRPPRAIYSASNLGDKMSTIIASNITYSMDNTERQ